MVKFLGDTGGMKICTKCKVPKEANLDFFWSRAEAKDGLSYWCRQCSNDAHTKRQSLPEFVIKRRNYDFKRNYGITLERYNVLYELQKGKCKICDTYFKLLFVDHNHLTDNVRGLLCRSCNFLLGSSQEKINILSNAIKYLEEYNGQDVR